MGEITFSLAIPHAPWVPERGVSMDRLMGQLLPDDHGIAIFSDKEPNHSWSKKMWTWGADQNRTHFVQLQDDVVVCDNFLDALEAMVSVIPNQVIGLHSGHPSFPKLAEEGRRWARSGRSKDDRESDKWHPWMVGVGYVIPTYILKMVVENYNDRIAMSRNEDEYLAMFFDFAGIPVFHPIPTIIDHDTSIKSSYGNDSHVYRKPTVTWHDFGDLIYDESFWSTASGFAQISNPHDSLCWGCHAEPTAVNFDTGMRIGRVCLARSVGALIAPPQPITKQLWETNGDK